MPLKRIIIVKKVKGNRAKTIKFDNESLLFISINNS